MISGPYTVRYGSDWAWSVESALILGATLYLPVRLQRKGKANFSTVLPAVTVHYLNYLLTHTSATTVEMVVFPADTDFIDSKLLSIKKVVQQALIFVKETCENSHSSLLIAIILSFVCCESNS